MVAYWMMMYIIVWGRSNLFSNLFFPFLGSGSFSCATVFAATHWASKIKRKIFLRNLKFFFLLSFMNLDGFVMLSRCLDFARNYLHIGEYIIFYICMFYYVCAYVVYVAPKRCRAKCHRTKWVDGRFTIWKRIDSFNCATQLKKIIVKRNL